MTVNDISGDAQSDIFFGKIMIWWWQSVWNQSKKAKMLLKFWVRGWMDGWRSYSKWAVRLELPPACQGKAQSHWQTPDCFFSKASVCSVANRGCAICDMSWMALCCKETCRYLLLSYSSTSTADVSMQLWWGKEQLWLWTWELKFPSFHVSLPFLLKHWFYVLFLNGFLCRCSSTQDN